jgi:hypothetical protein
MKPGSGTIAGATFYDPDVARQTQQHRPFRARESATLLNGPSERIV